MNWLALAGLALAFVLLLHVLVCLYNVFLHPLRHVPGPLMGSASQLMNAYYIYRGTHCKHVGKLHDTYGDVVRTGPNELSFRSVSALRAIYGGNPRPEGTFHKNAIANMQESGETDNIFFATGASHARFRKLAGPAFADRTVRAQEPMMRNYCQQLVDGLMKRSGTGCHPQPDGVVDLVPWTHFFVSDVLCHMLFGSSLGCLAQGDHHPWVQASFAALIESTYIEVAHRLWPYHLILTCLLLPRSMRDSFWVHSEISQQKLKDLACAAEPYPFAFASLWAAEMSQAQLLDNLNVIATAAFETTSSTIAAVLYYVTRNRAVYDRLVAEIRESIARPEDITSASTAALSYLKSTIRETFRIHPTVPVGLQRVAPAGGCFIDGYWVPGGTWVSFANLAACRSPELWKDPDRFLPERWLDTAGFESDNREASVPYSIGVRNCIGMSHANTMIRLALTYLLWNFDFQAQDGNVDPDEFLEYGNWQVEPLMVKIATVERLKVG